MLVREVMSKNPKYLQPDDTLQQAAEQMIDLDCGFIPVGDGERLLGTVTDRDIAVRAVAKGLDPKETKLQDIMSEKVLYVFEDDDLQKAAKSMEEQQVRRLIVLDKNKRLKGILSLGDISTKSHDLKLCGEIIEEVSEKTH
jgi:CBS domain-containing protein